MLLHLAQAGSTPSILAAERLNNLERAHNARLGMTAKNDTLPPRFTEDPMPEGPARGKVHDILEPLKQEWYKNHDWDTQTGLPLPEKLAALGLQDVADDLAQRHIISTQGK